MEYILDEQKKTILSDCMVPFTREHSWFDLMCDNFVQIEFNSLENEALKWPYFALLSAYYSIQIILIKVVFKIFQYRSGRLVSICFHTKYLIQIIRISYSYNYFAVAFLFE